jgi:hypothetical protein
MEELMYMLKSYKGQINKGDYKKIKKLGCVSSQPVLRIISDIVDNNVLNFKTSEYMEIMGMLGKLYNGYKPCNCQPGSYDFCSESFKDLYNCRNRSVIFTTFPLIKYFFYVMNISSLEESRIRIQEIPQHLMISSQSEIILNINYSHISTLLSVLIDQMFTKLTDINHIFVYIICLIDGLCRVSLCIKDDSELLTIVITKITEVYNLCAKNKNIKSTYDSMRAHYSCKTDILEQWLDMLA